MITKILAVASTVVLFATGAQAVTFNLTGAGGGDLSGVGAQSATFNMGGVSGTVTAHSTYNGGSSAVITSDTHGVGVDNGRLGDQDDVDGAFGDDWLTFTFDTAVRLLQVTFGHFNGGFPGFDDASVRVDGGAYTTVSTPFFNFGDVVATSFSVRAFGSNDNFTVSGFTVAPIPLPASALLLIGGLAGFGVMRRRKIQQI